MKIIPRINYQSTQCGSKQKCITNVPIPALPRGAIGTFKDRFWQPQQKLFPQPCVPSVKRHFSSGPLWKWGGEECRPKSAIFAKCQYTVQGSSGLNPQQCVWKSRNLASMKLRVPVGHRPSFSVSVHTTLEPKLGWNKRHQKKMSADHEYMKCKDAKNAYGNTWVYFHPVNRL